MTRIIWGLSNNTTYEAGVDRGVIYVDGQASTWSGITSVDKKASGGKTVSYYAEGKKINNVAAFEQFELTVTCLTIPRLFEKCLGVQPIQNGLFVTEQPLTRFGFTYRTRVGDEFVGEHLGYKIHIVPNASVLPISVTNTTQTQTATGRTLSYELTATELEVHGHRPTPYFVFDSRRYDPTTFARLETILYGSEGADPRMLTTSELLSVLEKGES